MFTQFFREMDVLHLPEVCTYTAAQQRFVNFCTAAKSHPVPATEATVVLFATHLVIANISCATIKVNLSTIRYLYVSSGIHDHFNIHLTFWLQALIHSLGVGLSSTFQIRYKIKNVLSLEPLLTTP